MRYLIMMWTGDDGGGGTEEDYQAWMDYESEFREAGALVEGGALEPSTKAHLVGTDLAGRGGEVEAGGYGRTELRFNGFSLIDCADDREALDWGRRMPTYGTVEVRPLIDYAAQWG